MKYYNKISNKFLIILNNNNSNVKIALNIHNN